MRTRRGTLRLPGLNPSCHEGCGGCQVDPAREPVPVSDTPECRKRWWLQMASLPVFAAVLHTHLLRKVASEALRSHHPGNYVALRTTRAVKAAALLHGSRGSAPSTPAAVFSAG